MRLRRIRAADLTSSPCDEHKGCSSWVRGEPRRNDVPQPAAPPRQSSPTTGERATHVPGYAVAVARPQLNLTAMLAAITCVALLTAACAMPTRFELFGRDDRTESVTSIALQNTGTFSSTDLAVATASTTALLERDGASGQWENPLTGARGTITPLATAYRDNGIECRNFLASYVREKTEAWMQGEACRSPSGRWEVRNFKPWRR